MKIDDFYVNLDSSRTYTQTQSTEVSDAISFRSVLDDQTPRAAFENSQSGVFSQGYPVSEISPKDESTLSSWQEVGKLSLAQQFKPRLNNLRQTADKRQIDFSIAHNNIFQPAGKPSCRK